MLWGKHFLREKSVIILLIYCCCLRLAYITNKHMSHLRFLLKHIVVYSLAIYWFVFLFIVITPMYKNWREKQNRNKIIFIKSRVWFLLLSFGWLKFHFWRNSFILVFVFGIECKKWFQNQSLVSVLIITLISLLTWYFCCKILFSVEKKMELFL